MKNKQAIKKVFLAAVFLGIIFLPHPVLASWITGIAQTGIYYIGASITYLLLTTASGILALSAAIFDAVIAKTIVSGSLGKIEAVNIGWTIVRDVSNLFLIFALVFIAIATILQLES
ncbi:MAG: hypothetical protein AAB926_01575, partial [Patescibacteria group bacterium]